MKIATIKRPLRMAETSGIPTCPMPACYVMGVIVGLRGRPSRLISARSANICTNWKSNLLVIALDSFLLAQPTTTRTDHRMAHRMKKRSHRDQHTTVTVVGWPVLAEGSSVSHAPVIISRGYPFRRMMSGYYLWNGGYYCAVYDG